MNLLMLACISGLASYVIQGKGFTYHLHTANTFLFLWLVLEVSAWAENQPLQSKVGRFADANVILVLFVSLIGLRYGYVVRTRDYAMSTLNSLESDLNHLGGATLSHHVQCLDMTQASCLNVLYRMRLVQSTGTISDFYLFADHQNSVTTALRNRFLEQVTTEPPRVFVLSNQMWASDREGYYGLANFPQFQSLLQDQYSLVREYAQRPEDSAGYRIYVHR